jgi:N-acetylglutamate synthase-like GNAT family acetyltransferase
MAQREPDDEVTIRRAKAGDAAAISTLVIRTLHETNATFYTAAVIESVAANFSVEQVAARMAERFVLVATIADRVVGTASLEQGTIRTVFVSPDRQGRRIGAALMARIVDIAREQGLDSLTVPSSINAEPFYRKLRFGYLRDRIEGDERIVIMGRTIAPAGERG